MGKTVGIILIVIGAAMLIWTGFSFTREEKIVEIGSLEISADKKEHVNWSPYVGGGVLVLGFVLLLASRKK